MTTPESPASGSQPERSTVIALLAQLQTSCSWKPEGQWGAYLSVVLFGWLAARQGLEILTRYAGILTVFFMFQYLSEQRARRQIDLLVQLVEELEKKKHDDPA